jgi:DNA helicase-2/ATP-dependent DNA helicase PcrA
LEYRNIFLINCNKDNMPHINSLSNIEEERRLFYVGISRAIDNLWITYSEVYRGEQGLKSQFIDECGLLIE